MAGPGFDAVSAFPGHKSDACGIAVRGRRKLKGKYKYSDSSSLLIRGMELGISLVHKMEPKKIRKLFNIIFLKFVRLLGELRYSIC